MGSFLTFKERIEHKAANHPEWGLGWHGQVATFKREDRVITVTMTARPCRINMTVNREMYTGEWYRLEEALRKA